MKPRRIQRRWIVLAASAVILGLLLWKIFAPDFSVVLYNNTEQTFLTATVTAGWQSRECKALEPGESIELRFAAIHAPQDVHLFVDTEKSVHWSAPGLAAPAFSSITLRVDQFGGVTATREKSWREMILGSLE